MRHLIAVRVRAWLAIVVGLCLGAAHPIRAQTADQWAEARRVMVEEAIIGGGIKRPDVIDSLRATPRHEFIPAPQRKNAYFDMALPIGEGQTISPPLVVAFMTEQLDPKATDKVLEIGTGSGYQAAVLSPLAREVYTIEIVEPLGRRAAKTLKRLSYSNVHIKIGDGFQGWPEHAPFDKIIVTCSPENVPQPLVDQLREGGRIVVPLGQRYQQMLYLMKKVGGKLVTESLEPTFFVPMTGRAEEIRASKSDAPLSPLVNGDFEEATLALGAPKNWYYVRQAVVEPRKPNGAESHYLAFSNTTPGRASQALQALGVDGRRISQLELELRVRTQKVEQGSNEQQAKVLVNLYDENRAPVGRKVLGPWSGTFDWTKKTGKIHVPAKTRIAVVVVGLLGATGRLSIDDVAVRVTASR